MTHPGQPGTPPQPTGGPQSGPLTPGQPAPWGPPQSGASQFGAPQPGAQPGGQPFGAPQFGAPQFGAPQPGAQPGGWGQPGPGMPPGGPGTQPLQPGPGTPPAGRSKKARIGSAVGAVVVGGGILAFNFGDFGAPEVGDCVQRVGVSFETVDCDDAEAEVRVVGIVDGEMSEDEFYAVPNPCTDFPQATDALWQQGSVGTDGTVYCAEPV